MTAQTLSSRVAWACAAFFLIASFAGPLVGDHVAFRYPQTAVAVFVAVCWWRWPEQLTGPASRASLVAFMGSAWLWCLFVGGTHFLAFDIGGLDFSVFEWMVGSTHQGRFGYSAIYDVNHFGVHPTFLMLALVPIHALVSSPWVLLVAGATVIWAGIFPLVRLVRWANGEPHGGLELIAMLAWLGNPWLDGLMHAGFRIEAFLPLLTLWFLVGWVEQRRWLWALAMVGLWCSKEDACLFLASFAVGAVLAERTRWRAAAFVATSSLTWLLTFLWLVQPALLGHPPNYSSFWSELGPTVPAVAAGVLLHPVFALTKLAASRWWTMALPSLLVPFSSVRAVFGIAPTLLMLGVATYEPMRRFEMYYPVPMVAFMLFGALDRWRASPTRWPRTWVMLSVLAFPLFGGGYGKAVPFDLERLVGFSQLRRATSRDAQLCAQLVLFPHLGVDSRLAPLDDSTECFEKPSMTILVNPSLDTDPYTRDDFEARLSVWEKRGETTTLPGGFIIVRTK